MGAETLFKIDRNDLEPGEISKGVGRTIELIEKDPTLSARLAGVAALANLRSRGGGPPFVHVGRSVAYPVVAVRIWSLQQARTRSRDRG